MLPPKIISQIITQIIDEFDYIIIRSVFPMEDIIKFTNILRVGRSRLNV